ncbi:hypothetical protein N0P70_005898 [Klebsiella michiganensis]|nr:hypothetical protein [Klebsiella michiganensis]
MRTKNEKISNSMHGNTNAQLGNAPRTSAIQIRCEEKEKQAFIVAANERGLKLSAWLLEAAREKMARDQDGE